MWESLPEGGPEEGWAELDENGLGALIGWAAGPENPRRGPLVDDSTRTVEVTCIDRDEKVTEILEPFTAEDRLGVDEDANSYLADAGVEPRSGGFRWFIRLPAQFSSWEEMRGAVTSAVYAVDPKTTHPADAARHETGSAGPLPQPGVGRAGTASRRTSRCGSRTG